MSPISSLPDQVWSRLKTWARRQADGGATRNFEECHAQVQRAVHEVTGYADSLRAGVVDFYAQETREMIERFRDEASEKTA